MNKLQLLTIFSFCLIFIANPIFSQEVANPIELKHGAHRLGKRTDAEMNKWREYGLGQFIHWGVYAIPGGQWNGKTSAGAAEWFRSSGLITNEEYDNLYKEFNPTDFDAKQWAKQAKQMGAKYMIFTAKHHDGFCLWPSKYTKYSIAHTPYKKDIVKQIVDAYNAEGIDVHLYFSIIDWSHKGYRSGIPSTESEKKSYEEFKQFTKNQLFELLDNYPTIKGLWFDGSWDKAWINEAAWVDELGSELRAKHDGLIIGSRFRADEFGKRHIDSNGNLIDDYDQRFERNLPLTYEEVEGRDWDCVMTIPENQWGYHRDWSLSYVKNKFDLIEMIVQANAFDGNLVINFGPDGLGDIRPEETKLAKEVGDWMAINGDAVYGVHKSVLDEHKWGISTQKGDDIYLTIFNKPINNAVRVKMPKIKDIILPAKDGEKPQKQSNLNVIDNAVLLKSDKKLDVKYGGRDKFGFYYYDVVIPNEYQNIDEPFVIKINLKAIDVAEKGAYQQAII